MSTVKGEYKFLKPDLLYRLQSVEIEQLKAKEVLREMTNNPNFGPDLMDKYIMKRRELYADVGLKVAQLSEDIRKELNIKLDHGWNPKASLLKSKANIRWIKSKVAMNKMERKAYRMMRKQGK